MHSDDLAPEAAGALAVLHARYSDDVHKHVRKLLGDEKAAEEVARAVFTRARAELAQGGRVPSSLRSWVLSIAQQEAVRSRDAASPRPSDPQADGRAPPSGPPADAFFRPSNPGRRPTSAAATAERPPAPAATTARPTGTGACPHLGFADDPANRYSRPTRMHRCFATGYSASLSIEEQRSYCLTSGFAACPRLGGTRSDAAAAAEAPQTEVVKPTEASAATEAAAAGPRAAERATAEPPGDAVPSRPETNGHQEPSFTPTPRASEAQASGFRARIKLWDLSPGDPSGAQAVAERSPIIEVPPARVAPTMEPAQSDPTPIDMPAANATPVADTALPPPPIVEPPPPRVPPIVAIARPSPPPTAESPLPRVPPVIAEPASSPPPPVKPPPRVPPVVAVAPPARPMIVEPPPGYAAPVADPEPPTARPADDFPLASEEPAHPPRSHARAQAARMTLARASSASIRIWVQISFLIRWIGRSAAKLVRSIARQLRVGAVFLWADVKWLGRRSAVMLQAGAMLCWAMLKRWARLSAVALRAAATLAIATMAALIEALRSTGAQLVSVWNALGPSPVEPVAELSDAQPPASEAQERIALQGPVAPPATVRAADVPVDADLAEGDPVSQALAILERQGLAVTGVVRDQRGMRVRGILAGLSTTRWYSYDECAQMVARYAAEQAEAADAEPELVPVAPRRRAWLPMWLSLVVVAGALTLVVGAGQVGGVLELLR
jgi:DNA-directed RNA polymerase specialized sigma24 family protein